MERVCVPLACVNPDVNTDSINPVHQGSPKLLVGGPHKLLHSSSGAGHLT